MVEKGQKLLTFVGEKIPFLSTMSIIEICCVVLLFVFLVWAIFWVIFCRDFDSLPLLMRFVFIGAIGLLMIIGSILALSGIVVSILTIITKGGPIGIISLIGFLILTIISIVLRMRIL
jgi:hypothetical protein